MSLIFLYDERNRIYGCLKKDKVYNLFGDYVGHVDKDSCLIDKEGNRIGKIVGNVFVYFNNRIKKIGGGKTEKISITTAKHIEKTEKIMKSNFVK